MGELHAFLLSGHGTIGGYRPRGRPCPAARFLSSRRIPGRAGESGECARPDAECLRRAGLDQRPGRFLMRFPWRQTRGFSLVEVIIAVGIFATTLAVILALLA